MLAWPPQLDGTALRRLQREAWPGNVRQLQNSIQRSLALLGDGKVLGEDELVLDAHPGTAGVGASAREGESLKDLLARVEREHIARALEASGGRVTATAARLGISRQYLHRKLRDLGLRGGGRPSDS